MPMPDGPFAYGSSFVLGGEQPRFFRTPRDGGDEEIVLDGDSEAEGKAYFRLGGVDHSSDHARLVWAYDDKGSEFYTLKIRDIASGTDLRRPDRQHRRRRASGTRRTRASSTPALDDNHRPSKIFHHRLGDAAIGRPPDLRGDRSRLLHERRRHAHERLDLHRHPRSRDVRIPRPAGRRSDAPSRSSSPRARPASSTTWRKAATSSSS